MPMAESDSKSTAAHWLDKFDWDDVTDVEQCSENWFDEVKRELNVKSGDATALTKERFNSNKVRKDTLSSWLQEAAEIMERQLKIINTFKNTTNVLKTELIEDKTKVVEAQEKLPEFQRDQLSLLKCAVITTVHNTVQKEIKSNTAT